jgi:hypothetical protein
MMSGQRHAPPAICSRENPAFNNYIVACTSMFIAEVLSTLRS